MGGGLLEEVGISRDLFAPSRRGLVPRSRNPWRFLRNRAATERRGRGRRPRPRLRRPGRRRHAEGHHAQLARYSGGDLPAARAPAHGPQVGHQGYTQGAHVAGQYYVFGGQYTSGASVEWLREVLGGVDYDTLIAEAEEVPPGSSAPSSCRTCASQTRRTTIPQRGGVRRPQHGRGARSPLPGRLGRVGLRLPQLARTAPHPLG